jgi:pimeloyl-ACP methyl ester carboxylesterase
MLSVGTPEVRVIYPASAKGVHERVVWARAGPVTLVVKPEQKARIRGVKMSSELRIGFRTVGGLRIRYADNGSSASQDLVLTSPWPESLHAFGQMWSRLSSTARLLAIDLPGFGRSAGRADLFSPMAMSEFLIRVLDEWDITDPHMACPGLGTPAALFAVATHPGRIRSLVVGSSSAAYPLAVGGVLKELIEAPGIDTFRSQDPRGLVEGLMATLGPAVPSPGVIGDYVESNSGDRFAESARYVRSYPEQLPLLAGLLPQIFTPVEIITGRRDPLAPVANAEFLAARLPNSRLDVLDAGHLAWEEASAHYGAIIAAWINGGYLAGSTAMGQT